jgi:hypothetical protein
MTCALVELVTVEHDLAQLHGECRAAARDTPDERPDGRCGCATGEYEEAQGIPHGSTPVATIAPEQPVCSSQACVDELWMWCVHSARAFDAREQIVLGPRYS